MAYIDPLTNYGFNRLFGTEPNKVLLIDFLNQILDKKIKDLTYATNEQLGMTHLDRKAIFDLYCVSESGERFIVEMQKAKQNFFKDRSVFYATFPIQEQAKANNWNFQLDAVYLVGILDFVFDKNEANENFIHYVSLKDQRGSVFYDKLHFVYVELPRFKKQTEELVTQQDKWLYVLRHLQELQTMPDPLKEPVFEQLFHSAALANMNVEERQSYERSLKYYRDIQNVVDTSKEEGMREGLKEGLKEGMKEGIKEGLKEGLEKGETQKAIAIAKGLLAKGMEVDFIVDVVGLTIEQVEALKKE